MRHQPLFLSRLALRRRPLAYWTVAVLGAALAALVVGGLTARAEAAAARFGGLRDVVVVVRPLSPGDEVAEADGWTFGRRRSAYVALWSWRPVAWRRHDPAAVFTNGLREPFDLVAEGGADNVWIVEVGDVDASGSFAAFCDALRSTTPMVDDPGWDGTGAHPGFAVRFPSPSQGPLETTVATPLRVAGREVPIARDDRFDNAFGHVPRGTTTIDIQDAAGGWRIVLAAGVRLTAPAAHLPR